MTIYRIELLEWRSPDLTVDVTCAPGTYIRSLAHDLGQRLGCGAHLAGADPHPERPLQPGRGGDARGAGRGGGAGGARGRPGRAPASARRGPGEPRAGARRRRRRPSTCSTAGRSRPVRGRVDCRTRAAIRAWPSRGSGSVAVGDPGSIAPATWMAAEGYSRTAGGRVIAIVQRRGGRWWPQKVFA